MFLVSQFAKYYIAVLISVNSPNQPPQGWVQMLHSFDSKAECEAELKENEYRYFISVMKHHANIIKKVEMMQCMTQQTLDSINDDLGHPLSRKKNEGLGI